MMIYLSKIKRKHIIYFATVLAVYQGVSEAFSQQSQAVAARQKAAAMQQRQMGRTMPSSGAYSLSRVGGGGSTRGAATGGSLSGLQTALSAFSSDVGRSPTTAEGLNALITRPPGVRNWKGPYVSVTSHTPFMDPWGNSYRYVSTPNGRSSITTISSDGPDRTYGTPDDLFVRF